VPSQKNFLVVVAFQSAVLALAGCEASPDLDTSKSLFERKTISPIEDKAWIRDSFSKFFCLDSEFRKSYALNVPLTEIISMSGESVVGLGENCIYAGELVDSKIKFDRTTKTPVVGLPIHLIRLDRDTFCVFAQQESSQDLFAFRILEDKSENNSNSVPFQKVSTAELRTPFINETHVVGTTRASCMVVSTACDGIRIVELDENGQLRPLNCDSLRSQQHTQWVDWSADGNWIAETRCQPRFSKDQLKLEFFIVISKIHIEGLKIVVTDQLSHGFEFGGSVLPEEIQYPRIPVRFVSSDSIVIASPLGWTQLEFSYNNQSIETKTPHWHSYPQVAQKAPLEFDGIWQNSAVRNELFAIQSRVFGVKAMIRLQN